MPSVQPLNSRDPDVVGGHRLLGRLGAGGQGVVYLGASPSDERVAVKLLRFGGDARERRYFAKELAAARKVDPFCTARILAADVEGDVPYIVSEFIDGPSLRQVVREDGPLRGSPLHRLAIGTATALVAIHQAGVVHRDFKPANVLLGPDGPRVIDFGVAHVADATLSGHVTGTPAFMAPEQLQNEPPGRAADMFAWGGTIVYAATGRAPFGEDNLGAVVSRIQHVAPDLGGLDGPLRDLAAACLDKDPARRPSARQALSWLLGEEGRRSFGEGRTAEGTPADPAPGGPPGPADPGSTVSVTAPRPGPDGAGTDRVLPADAGTAWTEPESAGAGRRARARVPLAIGAGVAAVAVLAAVTAALLPPGSRPRHRGATATPPNLTWFDTLGLPLRTGWTVADTEDGRHVLTERCTDPKMLFFETQCAGFWVMGPNQIGTAMNGDGSYRAGRRMYYPASDVEPCPGLPEDFIVEPQKPVLTEQRQIGGRPATYSEYAVDCVDQANPHKTVSGYTEREWYVADRQILVIDVGSTPDLPDVLAKASWR
ncbi:serine/threonine protein kinase [Actinoallomurus purpureus]|uniref:serine/threonine-protein kinase n=1 Tax=Actinoallomurus purpureus TaxID=478114 RepID=UPI00209357C0|nr:serine/threonine-protein kinase [Actinoallomurus purpureus]MCO6009695.1 serine/threonine protein kinase [Actinoallomurus purpureus]